jgi:hypothetical protein
MSFKLNWYFIHFSFLLYPIAITTVLALTIKETSLEELTTQSALVVIGKVASIDYEWENADQNSIRTKITVEVSRYIKGEGDPQIKITQLGGIIGDFGDVIPGSPNFNQDGEVIFFLVEHNNKYWIHSIALGCFHVFEEDNGEKSVMNDLRNINLIDPVTKQEVKPEDAITYFPMDAFINEIESYLK